MYSEYPHELQEDYKGWSCLFHVLYACHAFDEQNLEKLSPNNTGLLDHTDACDSLRFHPVAGGAGALSPDAFLKQRNHHPLTVNAKSLAFHVTSFLS